MTRTFGTVIAVVLCGMSGSAQADAPAVRLSPPATRPMTADAPVAPAARQVHAVLRYDATTAAACRSFSSDASSEICLLLALHVIKMAEKPVSAGPL